jgi:PleD family two-component response regulator
VRNYFKKLESNKFNTIPSITSSDDETKFKQLENGVNDYIMKPFKNRELVLKKEYFKFKRSNRKKIV